jgi:aspartyl-tRNA(Asn)/glutamyl-tRNA(Gln) amidotransferase subunit A
MGYKPTYGLLSRYGVISYASSLDQVGILARSTADVRVAMRVMSGRDARDATCVDPGDLLAVDGEGAGRLDGLRVGIVRELTGEGNSPGVLAALDRMRSKPGELGAVVTEVSLPHARYGVPTYYLVATAEASSNLSRYDGTLYGARVGEDGSGQASVMMQTRGASLGLEVQRRILMGTFALSAGYYEAFYGKALSARRIIADEIEAALEQVDVLLTPTAPGVAFGLGERTGDPLAMYVGDVDSCLANLAGIGAVSVPAGAGDDGMPCGVQFMAPDLRDDRLWRVAAALQRAAGTDFAPLAPMPS